MRPMTRLRLIWTRRASTHRVSFIEEYANDVKDPDDPTLQVNIYVLLK